MIYHGLITPGLAGLAFFISIGGRDDKANDNGTLDIYVVYLHLKYGTAKWFITQKVRSKNLSPSPANFAL